MPAYPLTGSVADISVQRILVRQGVSRDLAGLLLEDMTTGHRPFRPPPGPRVDDQEESGGFSHLLGGSGGGSIPPAAAGE